MIERTIVTGEEKSKYFIHNNRLAKEWEKHCDELNGKITGSVNGGILEFELTATINNTKVQIDYLRQKSNNTTNGLFDHGYLMDKNTDIEFSPTRFGNKDWQIVKISGIDKFRLGIFFNIQEINYSKEFSYVSKDKRNTKIPFTQQEFDTLTQIAELKKISNKNKKLRIEYYNALGTEAAKKITGMFT